MLLGSEPTYLHSFTGDSFAAVINEIAAFVAAEEAVQRWPISIVFAPRKPETAPVVAAVILDEN